jgi:PST family polysaccharide transporter
MGAQIIFWAARQLDNVMIGARWGPAELGQYSRAYTLYMLPVKLITGPVTSAVIPALSRLQNSPEAWRRSLLDVQGALFLGAGSVCAILIATSDLIIQVLLGPQWQESVGLFQILSISIPLMMVSNTNGFIQISLGRSDRMLKWNLIRLPILIAGFLIGLPYGAKGVAIAVTTVALLLWLPGIAYAAHGTPVSFRMILRRTASPLLCIATAAVIALPLQIHSGWPLVDLIAKAAFCMTLYFCAAALTLLYDSAFSSLKTRALSRWKRKGSGNEPE